MEASNRPTLRASVAGVGGAADGLGAEFKKVVGQPFAEFTSPAPQEYRFSQKRRCTMATYVILSQLAPDAFDDPKDFKKMAAAVANKIRKECKGVVWKQSYALLGRFDVVDIVEAADVRQVEKAALIIRAYGHATTETMPATPWSAFVDQL
jgi:uncharacterized protein with GYD domain